jgi:asparagine synthase (glutamine-hydrolysing)
MFAAIIMRGTRETPRDYADGTALLAALLPYSQADLTGVWQDGRALIAQATWHNTPESLHEQAPERCAETGRIIASWVRLDNRDALCAALKLEDRTTLTDPQIILAAHRLWGQQCAARLEGDFSFVIYDPARHEAYCARDSIGAKPFFYYLSDSLFIAATSVAAIRAVEGLTLTPDLQWAALFVALLNHAHTQSAYSEVKKLAAAHDLTVSASGTPVPREYFQFDLSAPHADRRDDRWVDRYREAFDHAVRVRARSAFLIGTESSAGLDSSSIAGTLAGCLPHSKDDFHAFGVCATEDEPAMLLLTSAMHSIRHSHIVTTPEMLRIDEPFHRALTALGHPPEHWQMLYMPSFFEQSQHLGIRTLFSGYGGDEVVTGHGTHLLAELWHRKAYGTMLDELPGPLPMRLARLGKLFVKGPSDVNASLKLSLAQHNANSCLRTDMLRDTGLGDKIARWHVPDYPEQTLNAFAANGPGFKFARFGRLESAAIFTATYGVEYRYPMFDRTLLQQFFATPSIEKRRKDMGRYLHRRAMNGRVPERILWQRSKYMGAHIGGRMNVPPHELMSFGALPDLLRSIIDEKAFIRLQDTHRNAGDKVDHDTIFRHIFFFQLRQLTAWLGG